MSAHDFFEWLFGGQRKQSDSGWQRTREQDTDGYRLPDLLSGIAGGAPVHCAPGTWASTYRLQHGNTATPQDTGDIPRLLSARERHNRRVLSEKPTNKNLQQAPEWLTGPVNGNAYALPVQRQPTGRLRTNTGHMDDIIATLKQNTRQPSIELPAIPDLPTVPDYNKIISDKLAALPPPMPLPAELVAAFTDDAFLLSLDPMDSQELAVVDRTACSKQSTSALKQLEALARHNDDDDTKEVPAYMRRRHSKESE